MTMQKPVSAAARALALALQQHRKNARMAPAEAAHATGTGRSTINRIERGENVPHKATLLALATTYELAPSAVKHLLRLRSTALEGRELTEAYADVEPESRMFHIAEREAHRIQAWEPMLVHGLLQAADFLARLQAMDQRTDELDAERVWRARAKRQDDVFRRRRDGGPSIEILLGEAAMRNLSYWPEVEPAQLDHMRGISARPGVDVRVICGPHECMLASFEILHPAPDGGLPPLAVLETVDAVTYVEDPKLVAVYDGSFTRAFERATPLEAYLK